MTDKFELSRRKALLGLGTIGLAGAGAGVGTSALFSDEESFENNSLEAGTLDLRVDYATSRSSLNDQNQSGFVDGDPASYSYTLGDVKPGDTGGLVFCPKIIDNPGYLWLGSNDGPTSSENGYTEPEPQPANETAGADPLNQSDTSGVNDLVIDRFTDAGVPDGGGELDEAVQVSIYYVEGSTDIDNFIDEDGQVNCNPDENDNLGTDVTRREVEENSITNLGELGEALESGLPLPNGNDTYPASEGVDDQTGPCICIEWDVPVEVGNEIQGDSYSVDFEFGALQSRNNPNNENPFAVEVSSDSELVTALQNSNGITLASGYTPPKSPIQGTYDPPNNPDTFDLYQIDLVNPPGQAGEFRQYAYIRPNGQVRTAPGLIEQRDTNVLKVFVNQGETYPLTIVVTDQIADGDYTIEELSSASDATIVTVDGT
jgi:predicted ribosomally synthesized peptide with SipW-like signal peptide